MATASLYTNTETNPVGTASQIPGTMSALGSGATGNISGLGTDPTATTTGSATALPDFSGMSDSQLMSYLGSSDFSNLTGGTGTTGTNTGGTSTSNIGSFLSSLLGGQNLGNLAEFGALAGLGLSQANAAEANTKNLAGQLTSIGQPFNTAGQGILSEIQTGKVDPNSPLSSSIGQQLQSADTLSQIGNEALSNYKSGTLSAGDQARLDATAIAQKQAIAQQLGSQGISDSSVLDSQYQAVDTQTEINRQTLLDAQYQVGTQALQQVQQTYSNLVNQSLALSGFGAGLQSQAVQLQIQSDTQITGELTQLFGAIATGYGNSIKSTGTGSTTGGTSTAGTIGSLVNQVGKALSGSSTASTAGDVLSGVNTGAATGSIMNTDLGSFSSVFGTPTAATDVAAQTGVTPAFDTGFMSSGASGVAGDMNFAANTAGAAGAAGGGGAAAAGAGDVALSDVGVGAATDTAGLTSSEVAAELGTADTAGTAGSGAALGAGAGAAAAFAPVIGTAILAATRPTVTLGKQYWSGIQTGLQGGANNPQFYNAALEALNTPQDQVPSQIQELVWQSGIVPYGTWGMSQPAGTNMSNYWAPGGSTGARSQNKA